MSERFGKLISLTGIDGCGKNTQVKKIYNYLSARGYEVVICDLYNRNNRYDEMLKKIAERLFKIDKMKIPVEIRAIISAYVVLVRINEEIVPQLLDGKIVISNRYIETTDIYLDSRGMNEFYSSIVDISQSYLKENSLKSFQPKDLFKYSPIPDLNIFIDITPEEAIKRINKRKEQLQVHENIETLSTIRNKYFSNIERYNLKSVDGIGSEQEVFNRIIEIIELVL